MSNYDAETIVVGAGISGLTTAWLLHKAGHSVRLIELEDHVGGHLRSESRDGFLLEKGPFNVVVRNQEFEQLLEDLASDLQVVIASKTARNRYLYRNNYIHRAPTNPLAMAFTPLLSLAGKCRTLRGLLLSSRPTTDEWTIDDFADRRFGTEFAETVVSAVISGILAGDTRELSLNACFPKIAAADRQMLSPLVFGLRKAIGAAFPDARRAKRKWRGMVSIDKGLGTIGTAIADRLGDALVTGCRANEVRVSTCSFEVPCSHAGEDKTLHARNVILAVPARQAASLLSRAAPAAACPLSNIRSSSLCVVNIAFPRQSVGHPLDGFGFLVPRNEPDFPLLGVLWANSAFPHHSPSNQHLLRAFIGGSTAPNAGTSTQTQVIDTVLPALRDTLGIRGEPTLVDICPYQDAIPQYFLGHKQMIAGVLASISKSQGLHLVGNYIDGVSVNDCVRRATVVAQEILSGTSTTPRIKEEPNDN